MMLWLLWIFIVLALLAFNFFACDSIIRTRRELADMNKTLLRAFPPPPAPAAPTSGPAASAAPAPAPAPVRPAAGQQQPQPSQQKGKVGM